MTHRTITIKEMIPEKAWPEIEALVKEDKHTALDFLRVLKKFDAELQAKGVLPKYAAYALEYAVRKSCES